MINKYSLKYMNRRPEHRNYFSWRQVQNWLVESRGQLSNTVKILVIDWQYTVDIQNISKIDKLESEVQSPKVKMQLHDLEED